MAEGKFIWTDTSNIANIQLQTGSGWITIPPSTIQSDGYSLPTATYSFTTSLNDLIQVTDKTKKALDDFNKAIEAPTHITMAEAQEILGLKNRHELKLLMLKNGFPRLTTVAGERVFVRSQVDAWRTQEA